MMGLFSGAKAQMSGQKALRTHVAANKLCDEHKPVEAEAKYREAAALYEQAMKDPGQKPNVHMGYAILLLRLGEYEKAQAVMQGMRTLKGMTDRDWFDLRINYSICLWRTGELDKAIETAKRAGKVIINSTYYTTLGMYLVEKAGITGDYAEAEAFNREGLDYDEEDAGTLDNMAAMYEGMMAKALSNGEAGQAAEYRRLAREYYARAHDRKPRQITSLYALAKLYHQDGEDDQAREVLEDADGLYFSAICPITQAMMDELKRQVG